MLSIDSRVRAFIRNGHDWTACYTPTPQGCASLACRSARIDGEIVVEDTNGVSDFGLARRALALGEDAVSAAHPGTGDYRVISITRLGTVGL